MLLKRLSLLVLVLMLVISITPAQAAGMVWHEYVCQQRGAALVPLYRDGISARVLVTIPAGFNVLLPEVYAGIRVQVKAQVNPTTWRQGYLTLTDCHFVDPYADEPPIRIAGGNTNLVAWERAATGVWLQGIETEGDVIAPTGQSAYVGLFAVLMVVLVAALIMSQYISNHNLNNSVPSGLVVGIIEQAIQIALRVAERVAQQTTSIDLDDKIVAVLQDYLKQQHPPDPVPPDESSGHMTE